MATKRAKSFSVHYRQHHIGDHMKDTVGLSLPEEGAYVRLIDIAYLHRGLLRLSIVDIYAAVRAFSKAERAAVDKALSRFFVRSDAGWRHAKATQDTRKFAQISAERAAAGRKGGARRGAGPGGKGKATAKQESSNCLAIHDPASSSQEPCTKSRGTKRDSTRALEASAEKKPAAALAATLQQAGCPDASELHPAIQAAIAEGMDPAALSEVARQKPGKPALYVVNAHRGRLADAKALAPSTRTPCKPAAAGSSPAREPEDEVENAKAYVSNNVSLGSMTKEEAHAYVADVRARTEGRRQTQSQRPAEAGKCNGKTPAAASPNPLEGARNGR